MQDRINTFLHFSYLPDPEIPPPLSIQQWFDGSLQSTNFSNVPKSELIKIGAESLRASFKDEIGNENDKLHIVPLSGGLDSRTILANLLEHLHLSKIITITYGVPGSPDYERAHSIAKKAGVQKETIDLSPGKWKWTTELLIETAKRSERPTWIFDTAVNHSIQLRFGKDCRYWSGFFGDCLGQIRPGFHDQIKTWEDAKIAFIKKNTNHFKLRLSNPDFNPEICLPPQPYADFGKLNYFSQISFCIRQQCLTKHIFSPIGYNIHYPYLNPKWVSFILSVPSHNRWHQILYRRIQQSTWPHLFNKWNSPYRDRTKLELLLHERSKNSLVKIAKKIFPRLTSRVPDKAHNYIDWNYALRYQDDFKNEIYSNIQDLKRRKIIDWLDIEKLWTAHQNVKKDLAIELMTLTALEIHLKAGTIK